MRPFIIAILVSASFAARGPIAVAAEPSPEVCRRLAGEVEANLRHDVLDKWFPPAMDSQGGGFFENFTANWSRGSDGERSIVYQSRLTWLAAQAALHDPAKAADYLAATRHGAKILGEKLWDREHGGFYWAVDLTGRPAAPFGGEKHVYGIAFGIYAAAGSYHATHDAATLELAKKAFHWLDEHAHDAKHGGYFETLSEKGEPIFSAAGRTNDAIGTRYGLKSMNTHIHLLEAFAGLYAEWPDPGLRARLDEVFEIVRDKIMSIRGACTCSSIPIGVPCPTSIRSATIWRRPIC